MTYEPTQEDVDKAVAAHNAQVLADQRKRASQPSGPAPEPKKADK